MEKLRANSMAWLERTNPLRGMSISRAGAIFDNARVWGSPRLQYMYNEIEMTDPVLMTCVERRNAALSGLQQQFVAISGTDDVLADEQRDALARFANGIDNFGDTLERMDEAFFRGYCHVQPIWDGATVPHVNFLNSWNFMRDDAGRWLWNPKCHETIAGLDDVRGARLVSLVRRRAIDYPAIFIYIRKALGERDYGRFIERHGIPHAAIMMAPGTEKKDVPAYLAAADAWNNGQNMVLPNGATTDLATEARGTDPFTPFVEHQDKYIVLLATGGTLTSLAQADTGSLAGGAQMEVWREIVARDGLLIADALNRGLFRRYLEMAFPGRPVCAEFRLDNEKKASAAEVADLAGKLKVAGWRIDQGQLEEAVGYTLERDEVPSAECLVPSSMVGRGVPSAPLMNKANGEGQGQRSRSTEEDSILSAFASDTGPAADAIQELLNNPSKEAAEKLLADLPSLLPDDPALASVIAEEMAKQFTVDGRARSPSAPLANNVQQCSEDGRFIGDGGCMHPNQTHSDLVNKIIKAATDKKPIILSVKEAQMALEEGFYVDVGNNRRISFGKNLLKHFDQDHDPNTDDIKNRKRLLMFAVDTVMHPTQITNNEEGVPGRRAYVKSFNTFGIRAVTSQDGEKIEKMFTYRPAYSERKRK